MNKNEYLPFLTKEELDQRLKTLKDLQKHGLPLCDLPELINELQAKYEKETNLNRLLEKVEKALDKFI